MARTMADISAASDAWRAEIGSGVLPIYHGATVLMERATLLGAPVAGGQLSQVVACLLDDAAVATWRVMRSVPELTTVGWWAGVMFVGGTSGRILIFRGFF